MTRHLGVCLTRRSLEGTRRQRAFWLLVEAAHRPCSWLHLEAPLVVRLSLLERFLRGLWPADGSRGTFILAGRRYGNISAEDAAYGNSPLMTDGLLGEILTTGLRFEYACDVGSSPLLRLTVVGQQERAWKGQTIEVLAHSLSAPFAEENLF